MGLPFWSRNANGGEFWRWPTRTTPLSRIFFSVPEYGTTKAAPPCCATAGWIRHKASTATVTVAANRENADTKPTAASDAVAAQACTLMMESSSSCLLYTSDAAHE